jgi:glycosyltransferase involved in cell wall biosynthesis
MKIACFHVLNDYSGSPKVLEMVLSGLLSKGYSIDMITSKGNGALNCLQEKENVTFYQYHYHFSRNRLWNALQFLFVQCYIFCFSFRYLFQKDIVFYLNTIMPVGAAVAAKLSGKRIVYHYHENATVKSRFYILLAWFMQKLADEIICVSDYQRQFLQRKTGIRTIPNSLPSAFEKECMKFRGKEKKEKRVLMLSSLKLYKGTLEFISLAVSLPQFYFELVINDSWNAINSFLKDYKIEIPSNLMIWDRQKDVLPFYKRASLVLNLSNKELVVETFGMTVLEAMTAGLPVIVPTVGGVVDLVDDGVNGYKIDVQQLEEIKMRIVSILTDNAIYGSLSRNAILLSQNYSYVRMIDGIERIVVK